MHRPPRFGLPAAALAIALASTRAPTPSPCATGIAVAPSSGACVGCDTFDQTPWASWKSDDDADGIALAATVTPTPEVLAWQLHDTGCFLVYNMATMVGSGGCRDELTSPPPLSAWDPAALDTDAWAATCKAMGGTRIVLTAKHSCGFLAWKTNTTYKYSAGFTPDGTDVVAAFVKSARTAGLGVGFYYSSAHNSHTRTSHDGLVQPGPLLPNQIRVTQQEYNALVLAHLRELWTSYGKLEELWFDGGYDKALKPNITSLLKELQPYAVVFGGVGLTPHALGWAGTENGLAPYPAWSTWSPAAPAPPGPLPAPHCTIQASSGQRCFNDTARGSVLPVPEPATHDKTTLQVCAAACYQDRRQGVFNTLAGVDAGARLRLPVTVTDTVLAARYDGELA